MEEMTEREFNYWEAINYYREQGYSEKGYEDLAYNDLITVFDKVREIIDSK